MIVQCKLNKLSEITEVKYLNHISKHVHLLEVSLDVGREYVVYGMIFRDGVPWYYVCEEETDEYPRPHYAGFFEIIDAKLSSYWKLSWSSEAFSPACLLPKEWAENKDFYENLVEGNENEVNIFQHFKILIDKETME